jgi:hypothetical protein
MHGGSPAHFSLAVRVVPNNTYHDRRTRREGGTALFPHSPNLNPMDVYLWEHLKPVVYAAPLTTKRQFTIALLWRPLRLSATAPVSWNGYGGPWWDVSSLVLNLIEDILNTCYKCALSAVTLKYFRTHVDMETTSLFGMWNSYPNFVRTFHLHSVCSEVSMTVKIHSTVFGVITPYRMILGYQSIGRISYPYHEGRSSDGDNMFLQNVNTQLLD